MTKISLTVNGTAREISASPDTSLLSILREKLGLRGTKFGCGIGECGSCTVHVDGSAVRSCVTPLGDVAGKRITTIEGLAEDRDHPVLRAWYKAQVPQCGYCQPGFVMAAAALVARNPRPSAAAVNEALSGILCRCGTYQRIRRAMALLRRRDGDACGDPLPLPAMAPDDYESKSIALDPWIRIGDDNTIILVVDRSEMGQGASTALSMLAAEELGVDLGRVRIAFAPAARAYQNPLLGAQVTGGSTSVAGAWQVLRPAAASARMRLIAAAARLWDVRAGDCIAHGLILQPQIGAHQVLLRPDALPDFQIERRACHLELGAALGHPPGESRDRGQDASRTRHRDRGRAMVAVSARGGRPPVRGGPDDSRAAGPATLPRAELAP